jgi:hypothetical protein
MLASDLITGVSIALQDTSFVRWSIAELLLYLNQGQKEIASFKPNASVTSASVQLVQGSKQSLPSGGLVLIDVPRNMGTDGATPGNAIRIVSRGILDAQIPGWHAAALASNTVKHYVYTPFDPTRFYVYPPQPASPSYVEIVYGKMPTDVAANANPLALPSGSVSVDDIYTPALHNYVMYRAFSKDSEVAANAQLAQGYYTAFTSQLMGKVQGEAAVKPTKGAA